MTRTPPAPFVGRIFEPRHIASWILFTFGAGIVNAGAVLGSNTVVSHITGNVTNVALNAELGRAMLIVVLSFLSGAVVGNALAERFVERPLQSFVAPIAVCASLLFIASSLGAHGAFGAFGTSTSIDAPVLVLLGLLAASMGTLNSGISCATANQIRTTHLSGPVTDLGGNIVRSVLDRGLGRRVELHWTALRVGMFLAFAGGAFAAVRISDLVGFRVFIVAAGVLATAAAVAARSLSEAREPLPKSMTRADEAARSETRSYH